MPQKGTVWYYEWVKEIPLSGPKGKGLALLVDDEDYEFMSQFKWYAKEDRNGDITPTASLPAHRLIVPYTLTDHVNGNKFDNTRDNLREATPRQNSWNRGLRSDSRHGYKGIHWYTERQKFRARIQVGTKRLVSNYYDSAIDAARAYDAMARKYYGEFARLNFPDEQNHEMPPRPVYQCARPECGKDFHSDPVDAAYCSRGCADMIALPAPEVRPALTGAWSRPPRPGTRTGYKGVGWGGSRGGGWQAQIMRDGKRVFLGAFDTPEEAARVYDAAARELFGESAWLNFPEEEAALFGTGEVA